MLVQHLLLPSRLSQNMEYLPLTGKRSSHAWMKSGKSYSAYVPSRREKASHTMRLFSSTSILFPSTTYIDCQHQILIDDSIVLTNGKLSGSLGDAWIKNSSRQLSSVSKLFELFTSYTNTQQSAPL